MSIQYRLLVSLLVIFGMAVPLSAQMGLHREFIYNIPGLGADVKAVVVANIDSVAWPEVLATNNSKLVLTSNLTGSVTYVLQLDSLFSDSGYAFFDYCPTKPLLLLADVNRDSLPDAVMTFGMLRYCVPELVGPIVVFVDNVLGPAAQAHLFNLNWAGEGGPGLLSAYDYDADGYPEMTLSADSGDFYGPTCSSKSVGRTLTWYSFPDSLLTRRSRFLTSRMPLELGDHTKLFVAVQDSSSFSDCGGPMRYEQFAQTLIMRQTGAVSKRLYWPTVWSCSGDFIEETVNKYEARCVGDIDDSDGRPDILTTYTFDQTCTDFSSPPSGPDTSTGSILLLYRVVAADSLQLVWSVWNEEAQHYGTFFFHPAFPGSFFAVDSWSHALYQFDGRATGEIIDLDAAPEGKLFWGRPFGDADILAMGGPDYLMSLVDSTLSFWSLRSGTDVEDDAPSAMPTSFTLGQPYPNPFNPTVSVPITIARKGHLKVDVFNPLGQRVTVLHDAIASPGDLVLSWDATEFGSGVYLIKATLGEETKTAKAVLVK